MADLSGRKSLAQATVVNLLNPNPYLGWSLVLGPLVLEGWSAGPASGLAAAGLAGFGAWQLFLAAPEAGG